MLFRLRKRDLPKSDGEDCGGDQECYICLETAYSADAPHKVGPLVTVCNCQRVVHRKCLVEWQKHNHGTRSETHCELCDARLPP